MELNITDISFSRNKNQAMRNEITFNKSKAGNLTYRENQLVELSSSNNPIYCSVTYADYDNDKIANLSYHLRTINNGVKFVIKEIAHADVNRYHIQKVEDLKKDKVIISEDIIKTIEANRKLKGVIIVNNLNGYSLTLPMSKIEVETNNTDRVILSIKHRKLLDVELPTFISQYYLDKLDGALDKYYKSEYENVIYENYYEAAREFKNAIEAHDIKLLSVYPIYEEEPNKVIKNTLFKYLHQFKNKVLAIIIGQRTITLRVIRPYPIDESENIVRLSKTAMELLGLEETDTVVIRKGNRRYKARVLVIDDWDTISNENRIKSEQDLSLLIGIPAYMRNQLGLYYINTNVFVERDLDYFFRKHLNNQVITIISFMLSLTIFNDISNIKLRMLAIITFLISMIYLSFSEVREKISNK